MDMDQRNDGQRRDFQNEYKEFKRQFESFARKCSSLIDNQELKNLFSDVCNGVSDALGGDKVQSTASFSLMPFLSRELEFYNNFFENNKHVEWKPLDAASIILGSVSKFFAGTVIGAASDILQEIIKLTKCLS